MAGISGSPYLANMRILLMSLGSRGDMEPFLALGAELKAEGHVVGCCMPAQFETLAREVSDQFHPEDAAFLELLDAPEVRQIIGQVGSVWSRLLNVLRLIPKTKPLQQQVIRDQAEAVARFRPDEIVFHIKCIYPVLWAIQTGGKARILSPMPCLIHPTGVYPHIADQFFWSRQVVSAGFGVEGFPINAWSKARFARVVDALLPHMQSVHP